MNRPSKYPFFQLLLIIFFSAGLVRSARAQYYYKDLLVSRQTMARTAQFRDNKVHGVKLNSYEGNGQASEGFECTQEISSDFTRIMTHTRSDQTTESWLTAWYSPKGLLLKTADTSDTFKSATDYTYDGRGRITSILNTSTETDNQVKDSEQHLWFYDAQDKPSVMYKIKNGSDTTYVRFVKDEKGNIAEEHATRFHQDLPVIYYYYDGGGHLTDIVRYNGKAARLLPDNIFEYDDSSRLVTMVVVPEGSNEYQKWIYEYDERGLKNRESCYTKRKELVGRIEYQYNYK